MKLLSKLAVIVVALAGASFAQAGPIYKITDLGTLGGGSSAGLGVNNKGQVTGDGGWISEPFGLRHGFIWDAADGMRDLGPPNRNSFGSDINNHGRISGLLSGGAAAVWDAQEGWTDLGSLGARTRDDSANGINDRGQITGEARNELGSFRAYIWDDISGMTDLGTLGDGICSAGSDINQLGQITGSSGLTGCGGDSRAFLWTDTDGMTDLGTLGGDSSMGRGINDRGQVVGFSDLADGARHAFIWDSINGMIDLGTLGGLRSSASSINNKGQVVGNSRENTLNERRAFIWDATSGMLDLNDLVRDLSGWDYLISANSISDTGYITGVGITDTGAQRAFLLSRIPEPGTLVLLSIGLLGLGIARRAA